MDAEIASNCSVSRVYVSGGGWEVHVLALGSLLEADALLAVLILSVYWLDKRIQATTCYWMTFSVLGLHTDLLVRLSPSDLA